MDIEEDCEVLYAADHVEARNTLLLEEMDIDEDCEVLYEYLGDAADNVKAPSAEDSQMQITPCMDTVKCMVRASERPDEASAASKTSRASHAIEANECLLHGKHLRSQLQQLLNLTFHFFPRKFHARIMKRVCNCEPSKPQNLDCIAAYTADDLDNVRMSLGTRSSPKLDAVLQQLLVIGARNMSLWRLHELLIRAADDDYELLKTPAEKNKQVPFRMTVQSDIPHTVVPFFIGKGGNKICALQEKLGVEIRLVENSQQNNVSRPYIKSRQQPLLDLTGSDRDKVFSALEVIKEVCRRIEKNRRKHDLAVERNTRRKSNYLANRDAFTPRNWNKGDYPRYVYYGDFYDDYNVNFYGDIPATKEALTSRYDSQYKQAKSGNTYRKAKEPRVLEGSTCLNCLQTYENKPNYDGACRYHSGYLRNNGVSYWSCCGEETTSKVSSSKWSLMSMHATSGCCSGLHVWRPHRNQQHPWKGARANKNIFEMCHISSLKVLI